MNRLLFILFINTFFSINLGAQDCVEQDSLVLVNLYNATDGDNWDSNDNWLIGPLAEWYGVKVDINGCVYDLTLRNNKLSGVIPIELSKLSALTILDLRANSLSGTIPTELSELSALTVLDLGANSLSGTIPTELSSLSKLTKLDLNGNNLEGKIPVALGDLNNLEQLFLDNNRLISGTIPSILGNLSNLQILSLYNNKLSGSIPPELGNLSKIETIYLDQNELSGCFPPSLAIFCDANIDSDFSNNPDLLWQGDFTRFCNGDSPIGEPQIGVLCDDGNPNTTDDKITENCECQGTPIINCTINPSIVGTATYCLGGTTELTTNKDYTIYSWSNGIAEKNVIINQAGTYGLTVTDENGCTGTTSINIIESPVLNPSIEGIPTFCVGGATLLRANKDYTTYRWSNGIAEKNVIINQAGTYGLTVTDENGCTGTTSINISESPSLNPKIEGVPTYCVGGDTELIADQDYSSYSWNNGSNNKSVVISQAGTYRLTVTDEHSCIGITNINVSESPSLNPSIVGAATYCIGGATELMADQDYSSYNWSNGSNNKSVLINQADTYRLTVTDGNGCTATTSILIREIEIGSSCDDNNPNTNNDQINENCECQGSLCAPPIADAGFEKIITCTDSIANIGGTNSSDGVGFVYAWTTTNGLIESGASRPNAEVSEAGIYFLKVSTIEGGCSSKDSVVVIADNRSPTINIDLPSTLTCEITQISINATNSSSGIYQWHTENGRIITRETTLNPTVDQAGNYFLTITMANGCTATENVQVNIDTMPPIARINPAEILTCSSIILTLDASISEAADSYQWSSKNGNTITNPNSPTPTISEPDTYLVEVTATNGCRHTEEIIITEDKIQPRIAIDSVPPLNCTNPTLQLSAINAEQVEQYQWTTINGNISTATNTAMPTIDQAGTYELTVTAANGCINTTSISIKSDFQTPKANAGIETQIIPCNTSSITLDGTASEEVDTYLWKSNNGQFNSDNLAQARTEVSAAGGYTLVVTASNGCKDSTTILVNEASRPRHANIEMEEISCHNERDGYIRLIEVEGGAAPFRYAILPDSFQTDNEFNNLSSNTYFPIVKDANDCLLEMGAMELRNPEALSITINQEESLGACIGKKTSLIAQVSGAVGSSFFDWTGENIEHQEAIFEGSIVQIAPFKSSPYFVEATDEKGCIIRDTLLVEVLKFGERALILTPNGDGQQDKLSIPCLEEEMDIIEEKYPEREIIIVNRWGSQVYRAQPYNNDWDGRNQNGKELPFGTYYYVLRLNVVEKEVLSGDILLMR